MVKNRISVVIPIRGRNDRLSEVIDRLNNDIIGEIIIVDYCSDDPIKLSGDDVKIIRYDKPGPWNKAHAINIGVKNSKFGYIMTLDADILVSPEFINKLSKKLSKDAFIYTNKVKRINRKDLCDDWETNIKNSFKWHKDSRKRDEAFNLATGGFQCFPKKWFESINGLDENLVYYGGMDNITIIKARDTNMNLIIMNETILHLEHKHQKEMNLPEDERKFANFVKSSRWELIEYITGDSYVESDVYGSMDGPQDNIVKQYREQFEKIQKSLPKGTNHQVELDRKTSIMMAVINNKSTLPEIFVKSLLSLYSNTKSIFPNTVIKFVKSCQVNNMRNMAVLNAINEGFDYLICLDDDHDYPRNTIINLLCHQKDFVTGCTRQRIYPYLPTQFYKFKQPIKQEGNYVKCKGNEGLIKIECSGPVGMLMKVEALRNLDYPYYWMDYSESEYKLSKTKEEWTYHPKLVSSYVGGDYVFCRQLIDKGVDLWLDSSMDFPHIISGLADALSDDGQANIRLDDGSQ